jgi:hypothetical protein
MGENSFDFTTNIYTEKVVLLKDVEESEIKKETAK